MTIKAVIFDLDGTLVDSAPDLMLATPTARFAHIARYLKAIVIRLQRRPLPFGDLQSLELAHPIRHLVALALEPCGMLLDRAQTRGQLAPMAILMGNPVGLHGEVAVTVQEIALGWRTQQRLMHMLAVNVDEEFADLPKLG